MGKKVWGGIGWRRRWRAAVLLPGAAALAVLIGCGGAAPSAQTSATPVLATAESPVPSSTTAASTPESTSQPAVISTPSPTSADVAAPAGTKEASSGGPAARAASPAAATAGAGAPMVDTSLSSVPLEDIVFDTFGRGPRFVALDQAPEDLILSLRDAIIPIARPAYGDRDGLSWLEDDKLVMGYVSGEDAYAYPINVLNIHEIVNDEIDGVPVLVTYCPLCFSGVVYSRELDGRVLTFGNTSALYQSDLVMYDHQTGSYWFQVGGEAVVGTLTGSHLKLLPSTTMVWGEWKRLYPQTRLLTGTAGSPKAFDRGRYSRGFGGGYQDQINNGRFAFPVDEGRLDGRLATGEIVLTVEVGGEVTAFPLGLIGDAAVNHQVGGEPVVVFARADSQALGAFSALADGQRLTYDYREDGRVFVDRETGSVWDAAGRAGSGPLADTQLERLNTRRAFWFSIAIALPNVDVYLP